MVFLYKRTIRNILSNYIPLEIIICDDRDPPWIDNRVKKLINEKIDTFQSYLHINKDPKLSKLTKKRMDSRISKRMMNPLTSTKTYWSILKSFLNNTNIPCIPLLFHQNRYINKCKDKAESFNNFFANQSSLINNSSVLPSLLFKRKENVIWSIDFGLDDIAKIISNFPICGKIFERLIYNSLFEFFIANELISSDQSGFKPGDSFINPLLSITHHYS